MADAVVNQNSEMVSNDTGILRQAGSLASQVNRMYRQPAFQRSLPTFVALAVATLGLGTYLWMQTPQRTTLYAGLPEAEKSRVLDALRNSGVSVALDPVTGDVLVPTENYHSSRMTLAAQGLPQSAATGYDQLDSIQMGSSRSVEAARLKQSQELELARSISEIDMVISARVHLALPDKEVFVRQQAEPTASIFIQLARGRSLGKSQINAILHLVSASVPNLNKENVSVVDQNGNLLSRSSGSTESRLSNDQLEHRVRLEDIYRTRVTSLLAPIVGAGNINAQINLDIDYTRSEVTEEIVDPNGNALRSEQNTSDRTMAAQAKGIPGALANQPPDAANLQTQSTANGGNEEMRSQSSSEVKNYEVSRTVSSKMNPSNVIRKINAAVLVREQTIMDLETGLPTTQKMTEGELLQIEKLVADAIGLDEERGDSLTVSSAPFISELSDSVKIEWYEKPYMRSIINQAGFVLILGIVILGVVRPLLNRILIPITVPGMAGAPGSEDEIDLDQIEVGEGESLEDIKAKLKPKKASISAEMLDTANTYDDKVAVIRMIVSDEAGRVSAVFKSMMSRDIG
ncbi:flagellar basal-body MS-ring/collar protein FliF [Alphaproteobacteria bacterium]|jgi:flagellar M-ring protein FliF|nr:flagellar basal-body MS-ring/collar protein FliF [Alphaproteobacteria bacterium]